MKKSLVALLIALVVVCLAAVAFAAPATWKKGEAWSYETGNTFKLVDAVYNKEFTVIEDATIRFDGTCEVIVKPTCSTEGVIRFYVLKDSIGATLPNTEATYHFDLTTATVNHNWVYGDGTATCVTVGTVTATCSKCGEKTTLTGVKNPDKHADAGWDVPTQVGATAKNCQEKTTYVQYCEACKARHTFTKPGEHKLYYGTVRNKAATCSDDGYQLGVTCLNYDKYGVKCPYKDDTAIKKIPALGHNWVLKADESKAPTCTENGKQVYECKRDTLIAQTWVTTYTRVDDNTWSEVTKSYAAGTPVDKSEWKKLCANKDVDIEVDGVGYTKDINDIVKTTACLDAKPVPDKTVEVAKLGHIFNGTPKDVYTEYTTHKNDKGVEVSNADPIICYWTAATCTRVNNGKVCGVVDGANAKSTVHNYGKWIEVTAPAADHAGYWMAVCQDKSCQHHLDSVSYTAPAQDANAWVKDQTTKVEVKKATKPTVKAEAGKLNITIKDKQDADAYVITYWVKGDKANAKTKTVTEKTATIKVEAGTYCVTVAAKIGNTTGAASNLVTKKVK